MKKNHSFKLVDGKFESTNARNVLLTLINSKINFHSMQAFAIKERINGDTNFHEERIKQLVKSNSDIKEVLDYAEKNKLVLQIDGIIKIKLINDAKHN